MKKVYHAIVVINDEYGKLRLTLYFPTAQMRKLFCATHRDVCAYVGRKPLIAISGDLSRTRLNLAYYAQLQDFVEIWDAYMDQM